MTDDEVIDYLWTNMPMEQVRTALREVPQLVDRCWDAHEKVRDAQLPQV